MNNAKEFNESLTQAKIGLHKAQKCYEHKSGDDAISLAILQAIGNLFFCLSYITGKTVEYEAANVSSSFLLSVLAVRKGELDEKGSTDIKDLEGVLAHHDAVFHDGEHKEGEPCNLRETLQKEWAEDLIQSGTESSDDTSQEEVAETSQEEVSVVQHEETQQSDDVAKDPSGCGDVCADEDDGDVLVPPDESNAGVPATTEGDAKNPIEDEQPVVLQREFTMLHPDYEARLLEIYDMVLNAAKEIAHAVKRGKKPHYTTTRAINIGLLRENEELAEFFKSRMEGKGLGEMPLTVAENNYRFACALDGNIGEIREMRKLNSYRKPQHVHSLKEIADDLYDLKEDS